MGNAAVREVTTEIPPQARDQELSGRQVYRVTKEWQRASVYYIRAQAMCRGFHLSPELEFGEDTGDFSYVLAMDGITPVSTCRLHFLDAKNGKIERVVTLEEYRGKHYGAACIREAEKWMQERGIETIWINSRKTAVGFYEKLGYQADWSKISGGGEFVCVMMHKKLEDEAPAQQTEDAGGGGKTFSQESGKPFSKDELRVKYQIPNFRTGVPIPHFYSPITAGENIKNAIFQKQATFFPDFRDLQMFTPRCVPDSVARSLVFDGGPAVRSPQAKDMFGTEWVYVDVAGGAMVKPGHPLLTDINDWEDRVIWPDVDAWDWKGQAERSRAFVTETELAVVPQLFSGYFERLISLMDMENACIAMIDEDQEDALKAFLDRVADLYISIIDKFVQYFPVDGISIHDDWGGKQAPFFSLETVENILVPPEKKVADHIHELGLFYDFHCCGKVEKLVPAMLEISVDSWSGQPLNNKKELYKKYGDRILLGVEPPEIPADLPEQEVEKAAREFTDTFFQPGKPSMIGANSSVKNPRFYELVYQYSREK